MNAVQEAFEELQAAERLLPHLLHPTCTQTARRPVMFAAQVHSFLLPILVLFGMPLSINCLKRFTLSQPIYRIYLAMNACWMSSFLEGGKGMMRNKELELRDDFKENIDHFDGDNLVALSPLVPNASSQAESR